MQRTTYNNEISHWKLTISPPPLENTDLKGKGDIEVDVIVGVNFREKACHPNTKDKSNQLNVMLMSID